MNVKTKRAVVITAVVLVALLALALGAWGVTLEGVTLEGATLTVSSDSPLKAGDIVTVVAEAGSKKAAAFIKVT